MLSARSARPPPGERNNTLFRQTARLVELVNGGELSRDEVERAMTAAALAAGLPQQETAATIESAFRQGDRQPDRAGSRGGERSCRRTTEW